jgi:cytochrome b6-f complex iron-sulfur subunit
MPATPTIETREPSPPLDAAVGRRALLRWGIGGGLGIALAAALRAAWRFLMPPLPTSRPTPVAVPAAASLPVGGRLYVAEARAFVLRDEAGFYALSAICTHLGCLVQASGPGYACACHGSRFDAGGAPLGGPAPRPLPALAIAWNKEGQLMVDPGRSAEPDARLRLQRG